MSKIESEARKRLIVALDVPGAEQAMKLAHKLAGHVGLFKVGLELFIAEGADLVRELAKAGTPVFLDLKFHDIPNTVSRAISAAGNLGVGMINVHASGGREMMLAARQAVDALPGKKPILLAVTVLTSLDENNLREVGVGQSPEKQVLRLAELAAGCGLDGVVASAREVPRIKEICGVDFLTVTPGIRPSGGTVGDQKRVMTPAKAIESGSDYLVIGRPITGADDPVAAADAIVNEMASAITKNDNDDAG